MKKTVIPIVFLILLITGLPSALAYYNEEYLYPLIRKVSRCIDIEYGIGPVTDVLLYDTSLRFEYPSYFVLDVDNPDEKRHIGKIISVYRLGRIGDYNLASYYSPFMQCEGYFKKTVSGTMESFFRPSARRHYGDLPQVDDYLVFEMSSCTDATVTAEQCRSVAAKLRGIIGDRPLSYEAPEDIWNSPCGKQ